MDKLQAQFSIQFLSDVEWQVVLITFWVGKTKYNTLMIKIECMLAEVIENGETYLRIFVWLEWDQYVELRREW